MVPLKIRNTMRPALGHSDKDADAEDTPVNIDENFLVWWYNVVKFYCGQRIHPHILIRHGSANHPKSEPLYAFSPRYRRVLPCCLALRQDKAD